MEVLPVKTRLIKAGENFARIILDSIKEQGLEIKNGDIIAVSSKAISISAQRLVELKRVKPSKKALELAEKYCLEPEFVELIIKESEKIYGGVERAILTLKNGILSVNAGVDHKNAPEGYASLWPLNPQLEADRLRREIEMATNRKIGVLIVDSQIAPLRLGTRGMALAVSGFRPVADYRRKKDLYGKEILITYHSIADDLASAAHAVMGESSELIPVAIIRNAPIILDENAKSEEMKISCEKCVYSKAFKL